MNPCILHHVVHIWLCMPQLYLRVKYPLWYFVSPLHSSRNQELFKKYICNHSIATMKNTMVLRSPCNYSSETFPSLSAMQINNCLKSTSVIKVDTMKNADDFHYTKEVVTCNHQINTIHCQQR